MALLNLSNHPYAAWSPAQRQAAARFGTVVDLPFPTVAPEADTAAVTALAQEYVRTANRLLREAQMHVEQGLTPDDEEVSWGIHLMGETSFVLAFAQQWSNTSEPLYCSTTARDVMMLPDGTKQSVFRFVQFRWMPN